MTAESPWVSLAKWGEPGNGTEIGRMRDVSAMIHHRGLDQVNRHTHPSLPIPVLQGGGV